MEQLKDLYQTIPLFFPELVLAVGILALLVTSLFSLPNHVVHLLAASAVLVEMITLVNYWNSLSQTVPLFSGALSMDRFSIFLRLACGLAALLTVIMTWQNAQKQKHLPEYYSLLLSVLLGAHLLIMGREFILIFISFEFISLASYLLTAFAFNKTAAEGSLKYFLFGSAGGAVFLYGLTLLYGLTGTLDFTDARIAEVLDQLPTPLLLISFTLILLGTLFKITAVPFHPWVPDVYESLSFPLLAFLSTVPKIAGFAFFCHLLQWIPGLSDTSTFWPSTLVWIAIVTLLVGNFSALFQKRAKRLMAYSSIAQSGFLLVGIASFTSGGVYALCFYLIVYIIMNFATFHLLQEFAAHGVETVEDFAKVRIPLLTGIALIVSFISLIGLPPTAGFTGKLLLFSSLWNTYEQSGQTYYIWLLVFGLLTTVVALFFYLRIPYFLYIASGKNSNPRKNLPIKNYFTVILVLSLVLLFFLPDMLMGWINRINFDY